MAEANDKIITEKWLLFSACQAAGTLAQYEDKWGHFWPLMLSLGFILSLTWHQTERKVILCKDFFRPSTISTASIWTLNYANIRDIDREMWAYAWCMLVNHGTFLLILIITIQKCVYKRKCVWCVGVSEKVCEPRSQWRNMKYSFQTRCHSHNILVHNRTCEIRVIPACSTNPPALNEGLNEWSGSVASYIPALDSHCSQPSFYSLSMFWGKMPSLTTSQAARAGHPGMRRTLPFYSPGSRPHRMPDSRDAEFN